MRGSMAVRPQRGVSRGIGIGIRYAGIAKTYFFTTSQGRVDGGGGKGFVAGEVDDGRRSWGGGRQGGRLWWTNNELPGDGYPMRRACRTNHPPTLPAMMLSMPEAEDCSAYRAFRYFSIWLPPWQGHLIHFAWSTMIPFSPVGGSPQPAICYRRSRTIRVQTLLSPSTVITPG